MPVKNLFKNLLLGSIFGFVLSRIGFHDFDEVHQMFALEGFRLLFTFMFAIGILSLVYVIRCRRNTPAQLKFHWGIVVGSLFFGIGWALTGACPSVVFLQLVHGKAGAVGTLAGIVLGVLSYRTINRRLFGWKIVSCGDVD